jgi:purine-nucleoside phosphorylase
MSQRHDQGSNRRKWDDAIIKPANLFKSLNLEPLAVMISTQSDLRSLCESVGFSKDRFNPLFTSRIYTATDGGFCDASLVGPLVGAPYAVMILESLVAGGVCKVVYFGWCGAISPEIGIGDILVPTSAIIDEGTSRHYLNGNKFASQPSESLVNMITAVLRQKGLSYREGPIWSTDAIFRETKDKVRKYQTQKVLAVEMETSALFSVGNYHQIDLAAILVVSDELSTLKWRTGFKEKRFKQGRRAVCEVIKHLCLQK